MRVPPRVADGLVAAAVAGVVSGAPSTVHALVTRRSLLEATEAAGTLLVPERSPQPVRVVAGGVAHALISAGWGVALSVVLPLTGRPRSDALRGAAAGVAIAALDLGVIARRFPAIRALPAMPQVADHVAFGAAVALVLGRLRGRRFSRSFSVAGAGNRRQNGARYDPPPSAERRKARTPRLTTQS